MFGGEEDKVDKVVLCRYWLLLWTVREEVGDRVKMSTWYVWYRSVPNK